MSSSPELNHLNAALSKAQAKIKSPHRNKTAKIGTYSYKYTDLAGIHDAIREPFAENGLAHSQSIGNWDGGIVVKTTIRHLSGQWFETDGLYMPASTTKPQDRGGSITYGRKYDLSAAVGLAPDDDDDGAAAQSAADKEAAEKAAKSTKIYDSTDPVWQERMARSLEKRSINSQVWDAIGEAMHGRPITDLDAVIKQTIPDSM